MRVRDLDYELPPELIAQRPLPRRDESRLLVYDRADGSVRHRRFSALPAELAARDLVVLNDTRVVPARLRMRRSTGGEVEVLLLEEEREGIWEALARPSRRLRAGEVLTPAAIAAAAGPAPAAASVELLEQREEGRWLVRGVGHLQGETPLPPYIREPLADPGRYQTVYAASSGSVAAPTAGLHLTRALLSELDHVFVTLHVGLDTFRPVSAETLEQHSMHGERFHVEAPAWRRIADADRVVAVGTTSVRALEAAAATHARHGTPTLSGRTDLMIVPGHAFRAVGALVTNFHLPRSTLLALVMAFAGIDATRELYTIAVAERYRFYSLGDAMLIL